MRTSTIPAAEPLRIPFQYRDEPLTANVTPAPLIPVVLSESRRETRLILCILALYACIVVPLALWLNIWIDESYSYVTTSRDLSFLIQHCREFQLQPPAFFVLLWFWRGISMATWFGRMLPVVLVGVTLWLAHRTARKWFPNVSSAWIVLPLALNPWVLFAATEVRGYCLILLCSTLLLHLYWDAFVAEKNSRFAQFLYLVVAVLAIHTFYYFGFTLAGGGAALVLGRRWRAVRDYAVLMAIAAAAVLPEFLQAIDHGKIITNKITDLPNLGRAAVYMIGRVVSMEVDYFNFDQRLRVFCFALIAGGLVAGVLVRWRHWTFQRSAIPIITSIVAIGYIALTWKIAGEGSFHRHFLIALIPLHFSIVAIVVNLGVSNTRVLKTVMAGLAVAGVASSAIRFAPLAKAGDYRRVAHYIQRNEKNNEPIVMVTSHTEYPFRYYYRGSNTIVPLPAHDPLEHYDFEIWALKGTEEVRESLSSIRSGGRLWVYADRPPDAEFFGVHLGYEYLEQVLAEDYGMVSEREFYKAKVRQFQKK